MLTGCPPQSEKQSCLPCCKGRKSGQDDACFSLPIDVGIGGILLELLKPKVAYFYRKWYSFQFLILSSNTYISLLLNSRTYKLKCFGDVINMNFYFGWPREQMLQILLRITEAVMQKPKEKQIKDLFAQSLAGLLFRVSLFY